MKAPKGAILTILTDQNLKNVGCVKIRLLSQVDTSDAVRRVRAGEKPGKPKKKKETEKKKDRSPEKNGSRDRDKENKVQKENKKNSQSPNKTPNKVSNKSPTKTPTKRSPKASPKTAKRQSPSPTPDIMAGLTNGTNGTDSDGGLHLPEAESEAVLAETEEVTICNRTQDPSNHQVVPVVMGSDLLKEDERSPPASATATARPKTSGGRKPMKAKRNPELSRENSEEAPKVRATMSRENDKKIK